MERPDSLESMCVTSWVSQRVDYESSTLRAYYTYIISQFDHGNQQVRMVLMPTLETEETKLSIVTSNPCLISGTHGLCFTVPVMLIP